MCLLLPLGSGRMVLCLFVLTYPGVSLFPPFCLLTPLLTFTQSGHDGRNKHLKN